MSIVVGVVIAIGDRSHSSVTWFSKQKLFGCGVGVCVWHLGASILLVCDVLIVVDGVGVDIMSEGSVVVHKSLGVCIIFDADVGEARMSVVWVL